MAKKVFLDVEAAERRKAEFHQVLGEFILEFANVEREVMQILLIMSEVTRPVATSIFANMSFQTAKVYVKRIIEAEKAFGIATDYSLMNDAFIQLEHITSARNDIVHHGLQFWLDDDPLMHRTAHVPEKIRKYRVSVQEVRDMTWDLRKMQTHFTLQFRPDGFEPFPHALALTHAPWRYKLPALSPPRRTRHGGDHRKQPV